MHRFAYAALWLAALTVAATAQTSPAGSTVQIKDIQVPKVARPPALEEFLKGEGRADMRRVDDFRQRQPGDGVPVSQKTTAWIGYDDRNFYVVFVCESAPGTLRARLSKREDLFSDDSAAVFFDTYHDHHRGYEFFVNPLGVQADAIITEGQSDDLSFDTLWYSQGRLTPNGYAVMMAIPFRSLRFSPADAQTWGLGLGRFIPSNNENSFWPYITQKVDGFTPQLGNMTGLERISPGRNLQVIPYGTFQRSHFLDDPSNGAPSYRGKTDFRAGVDVKAVLHDSLTLDVALNPDFSQVESDDPQVTVNQRFEVQFPEKRPFFLENSAFFSTPENLFFSRRIIDPEFGARLTGKLGRWDVGVLAMDDRAAGRDREDGGRAAIGVLRIQREFGKESNVGAFFTERDFAGSYNRVGAVDALWKLSSNWKLGGQAMTSHTRNPDGTEFGGAAYTCGAHFQNRGLSYDFNYTDRSEGFHTDLGFVPRVDIRQFNQFAQRRFHPKNKVVLSYGPYMFTTWDMDHRGVQQDWGVHPNFQVEMARSTFVGGGYEQAFERFNGINFRKSDGNFGIHTEYFKIVSLDTNFSKGTRINYDTPAGVKPFLGNGSEVNTQLTIRPTSRMKVEGIYFLTRLHTRDPHPQGVFVNHLMRSRVNYQFTRALSLRVIVDYNAVLENPALIGLKRQKRVTGDALLTYLIHPGTAIYVGYTDRLENLTLFPGSPARVGRTLNPSATTARQFFAKVSYLFRF